MTKPLIKTFVVITAITLLNPFNCKAIEFKGVNYTNWWPPDGYSSPDSDQSLADAKAAGCTWIAINVFWFQDTITSTDIYPDYTRYSSIPDSVKHAVDRCHQLGMKVMLKPDVDLAKDPNHWRGQIVPSEAWFAEYHTFINYWADFAEQNDVELLCIGCELVATDPCSDSWRDVANDVRLHYSGPIVYAANHGSEQVVQWWDAVDYIGIDAYYPLTDSNDSNLAQLTAAWNNRANSIESWRNANWPDKKLIFTEVGYCSYNGTNKHPWAGPGSTDALDLNEQADCYKALLSVCSARDLWLGAFWWNWESNPNAGGLTDKNITPQNKPAENIMSDYYITITGDMNDDRTVNISDVSFFCDYWLEQNYAGWPDFNNDKKVNFKDLALLAANWQQSIPPPQ
jgi:hypothetical protein